MGTKVQNLPGYYSMRDLNEESSSCGWPLFYGDKTPKNGKYYDNYLPSSTTDACSVHDKDVVKRMMLEHEAIFKNQVYELHRLYRIQRDLMNDFKRKELHRNQIPVEASICTDPLTSHITTEEGRKWHVSGFPVGNSAYAQTSVSGAAGGVHSPLGSIQGISNNGGPFLSPDVGVLESSRPSKVRRKMFDLQLPADEYVDTDESEKISDDKTSGSTLFLPDRNCKNGKQDDVKLFGCNGKKTCSQDTLRSEQSLRGINGLADLNEPVQVDETYDSPYVHVLSNSCATTECVDVTASAKQKLQFFGLSRERLLNSCHGTDSWARNNGYLENNGNGKEIIPSVAEAGHAKSNLQPVPQVLKLEKSLLSSQKMQHSYGKAHEPVSDSLSGPSKANMWKEKIVSELHVSGRNHEYSVNKHPESMLPLHRPDLIPVTPSYDLSKSWSHSSATWGTASCSLSQKLMSVQTPLCLNASGAINRNSQSHQSNGKLEEFWPLNINSNPNPGIQCDAPLRNGFYPGSSSGSKEPSMNMSSISYDYLNHNNDRKLIPEHFINNGSTKYNEGSNSNCNDKKSGKDIDLNASFSNNTVPRSGVRIMDGDAALSWLRAKTTCKNNADKSSITAGETSFLHTASLSVKGETGKEPRGKFMQSLTSVSCSNDQRRNEVSESSSNKKILGVPIFDMPHISPKKELCSITSPKNWMFDINLPCEANDVEFDKEGFTETVVSKTRSPRADADSRNQIDLNLSMSEDEGSFTTIPSANSKMKEEIDLEAPAVPESEDDIIAEEKQLETSLASPQVPQDAVEKPQDDELVRNAAEAIVVLSSLSCDRVDHVISSESPMLDSLSWFADVVSLCKDNLESKCDDSSGKDCEDNNEESSSERFDYFEDMTLKIEETKEEDYMPKPLVPENFKVEETTSTLPTRTRKGPARRGRQKRDFQRDILPGIVSLSRHEVTEDLQTFGGIMRSTGHSWQSGLTRRNSSRNGRGRGRRRAQVTPSPSPPAATNETNTSLVQQLNNIDVALEDRSLTGWGKTTRRPRRQRCPAGTPPLIPIT